jgi:hypothetical protein
MVVDDHEVSLAQIFGWKVAKVKMESMMVVVEVLLAQMPMEETGETDAASRRTTAIKQARTMEINLVVTDVQEFLQMKTRRALPVVGLR